MRPALRWTLGATLGLTALALMWRNGPARIGSSLVAAVDRPDSTALPAAAELPNSPLPAALEPLAIEPATRDPFVPYEPPPVSSPPLPDPPAPPIPPLAPPLSYRLLGAMTGPDGYRVTFLLKGESAVPIAVGTVLDEGYRVDSVEGDAIRLRHLDHGTEVTIPVPPPPELR